MINAKFFAIKAYTLVLLCHTYSILLNNLTQNTHANSIQGVAEKEAT